VAKIPVGKEETRLTRLGMLGLAGVCVICVTQILTLSARDWSLTLALGAFSIALPALTGTGVMAEELTKESFVEMRSSFILVGVMKVGMIGAFLGLSCVFWHFHWIFGVLFVISSAVTLVSAVWFWSGLDTSGS
jgi:hypothetical protein